ncbi:MAG: beta-propeller domain-containing protein, partial [Deltaproteobacteria bacterium]|nr:beta-propeller domain-containing protein [Deltaproteobacteria bacterium]
DEEYNGECKVADEYGYCFYPTSAYWKPVTKVTVFDVSDKTAPKLLRETYLEANYISSRMINDTMHFVGYSYVYEPYYYNGCVDYSGGGDVVPARTGGETAQKAAMTEGEASPYYYDGKCMPQDEYVQKYQEKLGDVNYNDLLPKYYDIVYGDNSEEKSKDIICSCDNFYKPSVINGKDIVSVISFNLKTGDFNSTAIVGQWGTLYASLDSLYFASYVFDYWVYAQDGEKDKYEESSTIHKFDITSNPDKAEYAASGKVSGQILNQFSMSEYDGFFRVATTENQFWFNSGETESKNNVFVLKENGSSLDVVGSITGIAPTERIYSARFIKRKGYLVTFRQVDPLYTIDLADAYNPKIVGELKVPGFSTYLHPMGDNHLLAIGRDATNEGQVKGLKLSVFDIGDFKDPKEQHNVVLGKDWGTNSEAAYNHKAFNYFASKDILMIPLSYYNWNEDWTYADNFNGLIVFKVTIENGFEEIGKIDHKDFYSESPEKNWCYYNVGVRRSIIMDDYIYSLSDWGLKA